MTNISWDAVCKSRGRTRTFLIDRCAAMATAGIQREFPCQIPLAFQHPALLTRPRELTPVFYGCYDWHSAVHSHWLLVRALHVLPQAAWRSEVMSLLNTQLNEPGLQAEAEFLADPVRVGFERPYGLAWLLQLDAELLQSEVPKASVWRGYLQPLVQIAVQRYQTWLPRLTAPIRTGEHSQTAFALGVIHDWALITENQAMAELIETTARRFHGEECAADFHLEPSGHDFLSPTLAVADLMRRVLPPSEFTGWLQQYFPENCLHSDAFRPVSVSNTADGKLAHFAGLNFSRAWMAAGIAAGLTADHPQHSYWAELAGDHVRQGLDVIDSDEYAVTHWVGSFVMYALTDRGITMNTNVV